MGPRRSRRMDLPFELFVALRYLLARRKQAFISLISLISILGVMVGVMPLPVALALVPVPQAALRARSDDGPPGGTARSHHRFVRARVRVQAWWSGSGWRGSGRWSAWAAGLSS